jgi:hypothetical protein
MVRGVCRARARGGTLGRSSPFHQQSPGSARADRCVHVIPGRQAMRGERFDEMGAMLKRPFGIILLAGALLIAGLVGMAAFWRVVPRTSNTSPLAALFALIWSCTNLVTATLTWRRSRLAPPSFPETWVTPYSGEMGNRLGPKGLSIGSSLQVSSSK